MANADVGAGRLAALTAVVLTRVPVLARISALLPTSDFVKILAAQNPYLGYDHIPDTLRARGRALAAEHGAEALAGYLALVLLDLIAEFEMRFSASGLPPLFAPEFKASFARILDDMEQNREPLDLENDIFLKDLGICRLILVPCVSHLIYRHSGVPRRLLLRQPLGRCLRASLFLAFRTGGLKPFLQNHVHLPMRDRFTEEGRERCYRLVAELLKVWPDARGLVGSSWYYDAALAKISPKIAYLRRGPEAAGAIFLDNGGGLAARGALSRSPTRQKLHAEGRYEPRNYFMIWARRDILRRYGRTGAE